MIMSRRIWKHFLLCPSPWGDFWWGIHFQTEESCRSSSSSPGPSYPCTGHRSNVLFHTGRSSWRESPGRPDTRTPTLVGALLVLWVFLKTSSFLLAASIFFPLQNISSQEANLQLLISGLYWSNFFRLSRSSLIFGLGSFSNTLSRIPWSRDMCRAYSL